MLKYEIQLTDKEIKREEIKKEDLSEKYLAPNLSFVSGVTSPLYHLEKYNLIQTSNPLTHTPDTLLPIKTENVNRQGYVVIQGKSYPIESGTTYDYKINKDINYRYLALNGKYFYLRTDKFTITDWLQKNDEGVVFEGNKEVSSSAGATEAQIDTIAWIEDGYVTIDGVTYKYNNDLGGLTLYDDTIKLEASAVTKCNGMEFVYYPTRSKQVTKFVITKNEEINEPFDSVSYITRAYYINYKNHYISVIINQENYFVCEVPNYLLNNSAEGVTQINVQTEVENGETAQITEVKNVSGDTFDILYDLYCFVTIDGERYIVNHELMNANEGKEIAIYLTNPSYNIIGLDTVRFVDSSGDRMYHDILTDDKGKYIIFNGEKYVVKANICDRVKIGDEEYFIDYINGKEENKDCLVRFGDNRVPMKIVGNDSKLKLQQYGLVISGTSEATSMSYDIISYSGITIDDVSYLVNVYSDATNEDKSEVVYIDRPNEYVFTVKEIIGSSMLLCEPRFSYTDFSEEEMGELARTICNNVILNQTELTLYSKNKIFGDREITDKLAFEVTSTPSSSDDYFNLFDNLTLYTRNGYIHIPIALSSQQGGNPLLDNIVERDFFEYEKNKAINPIIDMEKDVYYPKTMTGKYSGSSTVFSDIEEIRVNLHFRTRDSESWKVNEDYNDVSKPNGWFVTDYSPYNRSSDKDKLMETSDLMGLLYFTNNDVFYQKSKISKSFLRFSFYDSTNQQNQNLLATSTVFMDEHRMFKTYVDNSRKNINVYKRVNGNGTTLSKISVDTEWYGSSKSVSSSPEYDDNHRIGSEFIIKSKYETDTSSEGYYIYMHKEYSEGLKPKQIFMKIEFNHAGVGRTIPFIIPMKWEVGENDNIFKYPKEKMTLRDNNFKNGVKLEDSYAQMYIPLYAVYDFKNQQYAYVFDSRYVDIKLVNGKKTVMLNLFEIKYSNGTNEDNYVAKIDFDKNQFEEVTLTCT